MAKEGSGKPYRRIPLYQLTHRITEVSGRCQARSPSFNPWARKYDSFGIFVRASLWVRILTALARYCPLHLRCMPKPF